VPGCCGWFVEWHQCFLRGLDISEICRIFWGKTMENQLMENHHRKKFETISNLILNVEKVQLGLIPGCRPYLQTHLTHVRSILWHHFN
jgi:hypothetical protein